jgi:hypothetical protein
MAATASALPAKADLDGVQRNVFGHRAGLLGHGVVAQAGVAHDFSRIAHVGARDHRQCVRADRGDDHGVADHAAGTRRIAGVEAEHAGQRVVRCGRFVGSVVIPRRFGRAGTCHGYK